MTHDFSYFTSSIFLFLYILLYFQGQEPKNAAGPAQGPVHERAQAVDVHQGPEDQLHVPDDADDGHDESPER